ncbi:hypothetical protein A2422_03590 [Candidatus Woesebacteria bacterium RIFOXYC1_FULL_31_51]|uniref:Uncharacterized protein n=1 Tax=Candidatus Woesebacteria bacterium GW2011_GWC2_31_9 TaxID=1618586 RepID=A0A0F9YIG2_9BACT|nr:MAG: hypothetical protein UR17_C0001G0224 [Candidatus Woesebacteria bacterium GW2011_GWF1_31_35]KKP23279.1 MAG: hypothetical protein UR11_C0001G0253 [Candidatus Woesebacteria bacterium GW2011_GWC1_30_29]KKP26202.1 MAG: hypothetical protein UR13_C0005G0085 [Candidatus Woesebacteria bacterium GW2011_GWD1_31_12]KKP27541.1 MAG: hypothetical protein UR16_C0003G0201 [Candidatus Woesebacteria bacterium GW2011_GWB1_31_29]KKP31284.1 MAG: hypothetical protein UR21_C0012G0025 [Candidatus Woesebacteria 
MNPPTINSLNDEERSAAQELGIPIDPSEWNEENVTNAQLNLGNLLDLHGISWFDKLGRHDVADKLTLWRGIESLKSPRRKEER